MTRFLLIALVASRVYGQTPAEQVVMEFMGHQVTLKKPAVDDSGLTGASAQVCFDGTSKPQCYAPEDRWYTSGLDPELVPLDLGRGRYALFFSAWGTAGGSGASIHLALLRPGGRDGVENLLPPDLELKEISGHSFLTEPSVSDAPILVTADFAWGFGETHPEDIATLFRRMS